MCTDVGKIDRVVNHDGGPHVRARGGLVRIGLDVQGDRESHVAAAPGGVLQEKVHQVSATLPGREVLLQSKLNARTSGVTRIFRTPGRSSEVKLRLVELERVPLDLRNNIERVK